MRNPLQRTLISALFALGFQSLLPAVAQAASNEQFVPMATYRVGAYASSGIPWWAGEIDYFRYINEVEGGINGVKLVWQECETEWSVDRIVECYERQGRLERRTDRVLLHPQYAGLVCVDGEGRS